jgi:ElaB/YqjD/DUF883 family membrane-anchored ribosome-binding protein
MNARQWLLGARNERVTADKLMADFRVLANDVEQLLTATASQTGQHVAQVRGQAEASLNAVKSRVLELQHATLAKTRAAGRAADGYVHANPWQVMAISAAAGLVLGFLLARDGGTDS